MTSSTAPTPEQRRVTTVLERMLAMVREDSDYATMFAQMLEGGLESLAQDDAFGTERQCDPRGDGRDAGLYWSMARVQGVDA